MFKDGVNRLLIHEFVRNDVWIAFLGQLDQKLCPIKFFFGIFGIIWGLKKLWTKKTCSSFFPAGIFFLVDGNSIKKCFQQ